MLQIRREVFETNSSSTHSVSIQTGGEKHIALEDSHLIVSADGYVHVELGQYGWEVESYYDQIDRLSYLLTMAYETNYDCYSMVRYDDKEYVSKRIKRFMSADDFNEISERVAKHASCRGVQIDTNSYEEAYIDHQSYEDYSDYRDFLRDYKLTAREFVFGKGVVVHTDNDNH